MHCSKPHGSKEPLSHENLEQRLEGLPTDNAKLRQEIQRRTSSWQKIPDTASLSSHDLAKACALATFDLAHVKALCKQLGIDVSDPTWFSQAVSRWTELFEKESSAKMLLRVLQRTAKCIQGVFFCTSRCDIVPSQAGSRGW